MPLKLWRGTLFEFDRWLGCCSSPPVIPPYFWRDRKAAGIVAGGAHVPEKRRGKRRLVSPPLLDSDVPRSERVYNGINWSEYS